MVIVQEENLQGSIYLECCEFGTKENKCVCVRVFKTPTHQGGVFQGEDEVRDKCYYV